MNDVQRIICELGSDVFGVAEVTIDDTSDTIETWDSLNQLNFALAVEERFNIQFDPDEMERFTSVRAICDATNERIGQLAG